MPDWVWDDPRACVDFVNTLRERWGTPRETLADDAALRDWLAEAGLVASDTATAAGSIEEARRLRAAIDALLAPGGQPKADDVDVVNRHARAARWPQLSLESPDSSLGDSSGAEHVIVDAGTATVHEALGSLAADCVDLIASGEADLIKVCANDRCSLRFVDRSRGGRRVWCSMTRCGNRAKVRRYDARRREASSAPPP